MLICHLQIPPVPFFTAEEEDYFVGQYAIQGYRNSKRFMAILTFMFDF